MAKKEVEVLSDRDRALRVRDPFSEMNRMVDRFFSDPFGSWLDDMPTISKRSFGEIKETDDAYLLAAEIPGIPREDLEIDVNGNLLTIHAEQKEETGDLKGDQGYRRSYRSVHQTFTLPTTVDADKIEAHAENGLLEIFIPKAEAAKPKRVEVQSGKGGFMDRLLGKKDVDRKDEKH
jgi:HSP20 family protein